jgi:hypothetical protein
MYKYVDSQRIYCLISYKNHSNIDYFFGNARQKSTSKTPHLTRALLALLFF